MPCQLAKWCERDDAAVESGTPVGAHKSCWTQGHRGLAGVTEVSSQPQSTTRPVTRPHAVSASRLEGV